LEAPGGFEPPMKVLQIKRGWASCWPVLVKREANSIRLFFAFLLYSPDPSARQFADAASPRRRLPRRTAKRAGHVCGDGSFRAGSAWLEEKDET
jgi:hypothetical protein